MFELYNHSQPGIPPVSEDELNDAQVLDQIRTLKEELRDRVIILGHHYQSDEIIQFADITGDSLELARQIRNHPGVPFIVFCGVHFMAETADMLSEKNQTVILPDPEAGCSLADTAKEKDVLKAWEQLTRATRETIIPITYINSSAALKAFVGRSNGAICTSSNAGRIVQWALHQGDKLLFFPDQHLGRNTCFKLGIPLDKMQVYDPQLRDGGLSTEKIRSASVILWHGYCSVHQGFQPAHVEQVRKSDPSVNVIVHPECPFDVVQAADDAGSTLTIIRQIEEAPEGTHFAVGTEINLVNRLNRRFPSKQIESLSPFQCLCTTMYRVRPRWLLESLRSIKREQPVNVIRVSEETTFFALKALDRMMEIS